MRVGKPRFAQFVFLSIVALGFSKSSFGESDLFKASSEDDYREKVKDEVRRNQLSEMDELLRQEMQELAKETQKSPGIILMGGDPIRLVQREIAANGGLAQSAWMRQRDYDQNLTLLEQAIRLAHFNRIYLTAVASNDPTLRENPKKYAWSHTAEFINDLRLKQAVKLKSPPPVRQLTGTPEDTALRLSQLLPQTPVVSESRSPYPEMFDPQAGAVRGQHGLQGIADLLTPVSSPSQNNQKSRSLVPELVD